MDSQRLGKPPVPLFRSRIEKSKPNASRWRHPRGSTISKSSKSPIPLTKRRASIGQRRIRNRTTSCRLQFCSLLPVVLDEPEPPFRVGLLEPIQRLGGGIRLIIVLGVRKAREFMEILGEPSRLFRQVYESVFNHRRNRVHAHCLLFRRLVLFDRVHTFMNQFLNQLRARRLVFDQDGFRTKRLGLVSHSAFQLGTPLSPASRRTILWQWYSIKTTARPSAGTADKQDRTTIGVSGL
jgi:hypothetical protein